MVASLLQPLAKAVQRNCHIADARHGAEYTLCVYLMKMREYYRWEKGLPLGGKLDNDAVGDWLMAREQLWDRLDAAEYGSLDIAGTRYDPFDSERINRVLEPSGLVYSGGLGYGARPHFFLASLRQRYDSEGYSVRVADREYARDLAAPPAMTQGNCIYLRRESLRRLLWEKLENWRWSRPDNALGRAFACYDFENALDASLDAMTDRESEAMLLHEQGEYRAGQQLGEAWQRMLLDLPHTPAELMVRAIRDHLADCMVTLPTLGVATDLASVHFYVGNLSNMRREIFPALRTAYDEWMQGAGAGVFSQLAREGRAHWSRLAVEVLDLHRQHGRDAAAPIQVLVARRYL